MLFGILKLGLHFFCATFCCQCLRRSPLLSTNPCILFGKALQSPSMFKLSLMNLFHPTLWWKFRAKSFKAIWFNFFVWATLGLRLFRFYHRNSEMYGLCWTLLDSCWTRVQHPKSLSYVQKMQNKFSHVGLCWTESNIPNHYLTSANFGLTPFRLL